jgi:spore coat protein A
LPDAWFTPGYAQVGSKFQAVNTYDNAQEAATLWYHDHALGITRLNVYAGLAGFYLLRDANEDALHLPSGDYEVGLAIQDRMFTADGQLFYPCEPPTDDASEPSVLPEFFGDTILVNGRAWPYLEVEPRLYRFRLLNGSDSRFYTLLLSSGAPFVQIGTDGGLLNAPVTLQQLTLGPGERADVLIDFSGHKGEHIVLRNHAKAPYPGGEPADPRTVGQIMAFRVTRPLNTMIPSYPIPVNLRPVYGGLAVEQQNGPVRQLLLFEGLDRHGRLQPSLGTVADGALPWSAPASERPRLNSVEVWEVYNSTGDTHPIHLHLTQFRILSRQQFTASQSPGTGALREIRLRGQATPPELNERGLKDTALMYPGQVTRIIAKFDRPGEYVWHCHILSHEDHEMMRPFVVES